MWDFLTKVYEGNNGGFALFLCFMAVVQAIRSVAVHFINRNKPMIKCPCHDEEDEDD